MESNQQETLVGHDDLESSPYLDPATFEPTKDELIKLKKSQQRWNFIIFAIGTGAFCFALAAMVLDTSSLIIFCFVFPLVTGPVMISQRRMMNRFPTLRRLINRLRFQVNRLQVQNNRFGAENTRLEVQIEDLKKTEFQLHQLCQSAGTSIQEMQALIKENGKIQKAMKVRFRGEHFDLYFMSRALRSHFPSRHCHDRNFKMRLNCRIFSKLF